MQSWWSVSTSQFNSPVRALKKPDRYSSMTIIYHILKQVVSRVVVLAPLLEQINMDLGKWYVANEFFPTPIREEN